MFFIRSSNHSRLSFFWNSRISLFILGFISKIEISAYHIPIYKKQIVSLSSHPNRIKKYSKKLLTLRITIILFVLRQGYQIEGEDYIHKIIDSSYFMISWSRGWVIDFWPIQINQIQMQQAVPYLPLRMQRQKYRIVINLKILCFKDCPHYKRALINSWKKRGRRNKKEDMSAVHSNLTLTSIPSFYKKMK